MKKKNFKYKQMNCAPEDFLIPDGYEIVPIGTTEKKSYRYIAGWGIKGSTDIKVWAFALSPDLLGKPIEDGWAVHIRKKRTKPLGKYEKLAKNIGDNIPDGYEIAPLGAVRDETYLFTWVPHDNNYEKFKSILNWTFVHKDFLSKHNNIINNSYSLHIRPKKRVVAPDQYIYGYMKPDFEIPYGYELLPIGAKANESDYFSISSKGSTNLADWKSNKDIVVYINDTISYKSFPHIRKVNVKDGKIEKVEQPKKKQIEIIVHDDELEGVVEDDSIDIKLNKIEAVLLWRLLNNTTPDLRNLYNKHDKLPVGNYKVDNIINQDSVWRKLNDILNNKKIDPRNNNSLIDEEYLP